MYDCMTVVVLEPNSIYRAGLLQVIRQAGFRNCLALASAEEVATSLPSDHGALLFLADLGSDQDSMATGVNLLRQTYAKSLIVLVSDAFDDRQLASALRVGADGFIMKLISPEALVKSLEVVMLGQHVFPTQLLETLRRHHNETEPGWPDLRRALESLSQREADVLKHLSLGNANKIIARRFGIAEATVKVHVKAILRKLGARNRTEAAIWARTQGMSRHSGEICLTESGVVEPGLLGGEASYPGPRGIH
jgi:two-component system, NarL family, nitrate/nitrite response regulator NarL